MNFSFLPNKIKKELNGIVAEKVPFSIARSSASVDGKAGEGYVIAYEDKIFLFSRELGQSEYSKFSADLGNIGKVNVKKDGINSLLDLELGGKKYSMKFSSFEEKNLKTIADNWISKAGASQTNESAETNVAPVETGQYGNQEVELNPEIGMAAAMMYVASVDDDISKEEDYYIIAIMGNNKELLQKGLAYYKTHSFDQLLNELDSLTTEQNLCFLANMMELGMKDGVLHSSELNLMRKFSDAMKITDDQYNTIKQVLLIKNKISVLNT